MYQRQVELNEHEDFRGNPMLYSAFTEKNSYTCKDSVEIKYKLDFNQDPNYNQYVKEQDKRAKIENNLELF
jgi:hypothetical protein